MSVNLPPPPCPFCGGGAQVTAGQVVAGGKLRWSRSTRCPGCGCLEEDGIGLPPGEIRAILLERDGEWQLLVDGTARVVAVKVVRKAMEMPVEQAFRLLKSTGAVFRGTKTEAVWMRSLMADAGVNAAVERVDSRITEEP